MKNSSSEHWGPERIRDLRLRLGWSAAELGRRTGCSVEIVRRWESGENQPSDETYRQLVYLSVYVEENAQRMVQMPLAEILLDREGLNQITSDMVTRLGQK